MTPEQIAEILASYNKVRNEEDENPTGSFIDIQFLLDEFSYILEKYSYSNGFNETEFRQKVLGL